MKKIIELINKYWRFDNGQQPLSSWHEKQDLIEKLQSMEKKKYEWDQFSGQDEITTYLNSNKVPPENVVAVNNDDRGNWWLIYLK